MRPLILRRAATFVSTADISKRCIGKLAKDGEATLDFLARTIGK
jgi:hypothetical protein